jgi:hypothetical protein
MNLPPNTELVREVLIASSDRGLHRKAIEAKETADVATDIASKAIGAHRRAVAELAKAIGERENLGDGKAMHDAGILLDIDIARGTILILKKLPEVKPATLPPPNVPYICLHCKMPIMCGPIIVDQNEGAVHADCLKPWNEAKP